MFLCLWCGFCAISQNSPIQEIFSQEWEIFRGVGTREIWVPLTSLVITVWEWRNGGSDDQFAVPITPMHSCTHYTCTHTLTHAHKVNAATYHARGCKIQTDCSGGRTNHLHPTVLRNMFSHKVCLLYSHAATSTTCAQQLLKQSLT